MLVLVTTVRVNPSGKPFQLGIAVTCSGRARTICRVEGNMRALGHDRVVLERRGKVIVARRWWERRSARVKVSGHNRG